MNRTGDVEKENNNKEIQVLMIHVRYPQCVLSLFVVGSLGCLHRLAFHPFLARAMNAEKMSDDDLKDSVGRLCCRAIPPLVMPEVPPGCFTMASFPMTDLENKTHGVHFLDINADHPDDIDFFAFGLAYTLAGERKGVPS